jgi:SWI/SNF-related matrix-associated actin-dependent regulator 1 of chromatin subfamily A
MSDFKIVYKDGRFVATGKLPKSDLKYAGWFVFKNKDEARTGRLAAVLPFADACVGDAKLAVDQEMTAKQFEVRDSFAAEGDIKVPAPDGLSYRGYQLAGIQYMVQRWGVLNADVPRLGKTIQTLGVANYYARPLGILIICPAIAKVGWAREAKKWLVRGHTIGIAEGNDLPDTQVVIINYDILARHADKLLEREWDIVCCDEAHMLGSAKSKRTKAAMKFKPLLHFICLTGTPAFTRPIQLWPMMEKLDPNDIGRSWKRFVYRYCAAHHDGFSLNVSGYSNLEELQFKMRKRFMIRREKSDVLDELPPMRKMVYLPSKGLTKLIKQERSAMQENLAKLLGMIREGGVDENDASFKALADNNGVDGKSAEARRELALRKVSMVRTYVDELLETEDKVIVFYHHRDPLDEFYKSYPPDQIARVWGGMTPKQREDERVRFQNDPACRIIVANLQAASTAIELSASEVVVFAEFARAVPSEFDQAEERPWLPTKETPIEIHNLVVEGSVEADIAEALEYRRGALKRLTCRSNLV